MYSVGGMDMFGRLAKVGEWGKVHEESENLAMQAEQLVKSDIERAKELYYRAAVKEERSVDLLLSEDKPRTYQIFAVSAAALYFKAGDFVNSRRIVEVHKDNLTENYYQARMQEVLDALDGLN